MTLAHSEFGGSSAARWMNCPGSVALARNVPERAPSVYADEGTRAHAVCEFCLLNGVRQTRDLFTRTDVGSYDMGWPQLTDELLDAVQVYLDSVWAEVDASPDAVLRVEERFVLSLPHAEKDEVFGRNDAIVYSRERGRLVVYDFKYGAGVSVRAENNAQLQFYLAGAALSFKDDPVWDTVIRIVQPRASDVANLGAVREWNYDPVEMFAFFDKLDAAVAAAKQDGAPLVAGSWCRFCPAAPACTVVERNFLEAAKLDLASVSLATVKTLPDVRSLDPARIGAILSAWPAIEGWVGMLQDYAHAMLTDGVEVPGWKLVDKRARRKWLEPGEKTAYALAADFGLPLEEVWPRKLETITNVELLLAKVVKDPKDRKAAIDLISLQHTVKDSSGTTIAPVADKRPAVNAAARDFLGVRFNEG